MHRLFYELFDDDDLLRISSAIKEMEKITAGEIVVSVKEKRGIFQGSASIRSIAEKEFVRLKMHATRDRTGILLFIILKSRELIVLGDEGIHSKVGDEAWENIKDLILGRFRKGEFCDGIINAVNEMGRILSLHFPIKPDDTNEISNRVIIRP